ncbi:MAG: Hpt domain-containing protein [Phycisphaerae bacterium]
MSSANAGGNEKIGSELVREDPSFADIVVQFIDGLDQRLQTMTDAIEKADFDALRVAAHQLKGSGGGYGYPVLTEGAGKLEQFAKQQALSECQETLKELRLLCDRVVVDDSQ